MILICKSSHTWRNKRKSLSKHFKTLKGFRFLLVNQKIARALHVTLKVVTSPCAKFKGYVTLPSNFSNKIRVHTNRCIVSRRILIHVRIRSTYSTNFYDEFFCLVNVTPESMAVIYTWSRTPAEFIIVQKWHHIMFKLRHGSNFHLKCIEPHVFKFCSYSLISFQTFSWSCLVNSSRTRFAHIESILSEIDW